MVNLYLIQKEVFQPPHHKEKRGREGSLLLYPFLSPLIVFFFVVLCVSCPWLCVCVCCLFRVTLQRKKKWGESIQFRNGINLVITSSSSPSHFLTELA